MKTREQCKGMTDKQYEIACAKEELMQIKSWLSDNDWKVNKIVIGEWDSDDIRWEEYLNERALKRARQDELNELLNELLNK